MWCPRCGKEGEIVIFKVNGRDIYLQVCDECESTWMENIIPSLDTRRDFEEVMHTFGLQGTFHEVTRVDDYTKPS